MPGGKFERVSVFSFENDTSNSSIDSYCVSPFWYEKRRIFLQFQLQCSSSYYAAVVVVRWLSLSDLFLFSPSLHHLISYRFCLSLFSRQATTDFSLSFIDNSIYRALIKETSKNEAGPPFQEVWNKLIANTISVFRRSALWHTVPKNENGWKMMLLLMVMVTVTVCG